MSDNPSKMSPQQRASHSKRHASFSSPREVPLPSPALSLADSPFFLDHQQQSSIQPPRSPTLQAPPRPQDDRSMASVAQDCLAWQQNQPEATQLPQPQPDPHLSTKPCGPEPRAIRHASTQEPSELTLHRQRQVAATLPDPPSSAWLDRYSSASLPLPSQIPFHTLSSQRQSNPRTANSGPDLSPPPASPAPPDSPTPSPSTECPKLDSGNSSSSSSSSYSSSEGPSSSSSSSSLSKNASHDKEISNAPPSPDPSPIESRPSPPPRPISPFRAPQPPPPQPRPPPLSEGTAMRRFMTASQLQSMAMANNSSNYASLSSTMHSMAEASSYPPPEPPTILPVEPNFMSQALLDPRQAPYMPFLSHALLPPDSSWIEVETASTEYKLLVRLPGFSREGITIATKRRRILHIVADSWENGGGHFERKISFGYDADLGQVRAEFDGVMLRIAIPRRISPITWSGSTSRMGSSGRA